MAISIFSQPVLVDVKYGNYQLEFQCLPPSEASFAEAHRVFRAARIQQQIGSYDENDDADKKSKLFEAALKKFFDEVVFGVTIEVPIDYEGEDELEEIAPADVPFFIKDQVVLSLTNLGEVTGSRLKN